MIAGFLGLVAFVLVLFCAGALAESNVQKAMKFGAAAAVCFVAIIISSGKLPSDGFQECYTDWDGFANSEVCY